MSEPIVYVARGCTYDRAAEETRRLLEASGAMDALAGPPARVVVKPNLIHASPPHEAATTHPEVVRGVVEALHRLGHRVVIADSYSGAFPWSRRGLQRVYHETGMGEVARMTNASLSFDLSWEIRPISSRVLARVEALRVVTEADFIVNVPKLKTHAYTGFTCAVKNLFGVVPGHFKVGYHARFSDLDRFNDALRDFALSLPVRLTVMDGVEAMEGEGPAAGVPRHLGVLVVGEDLLAVDRYAARCCGMSPRSFPWLNGDRLVIEGPTPEEAIPGGLVPATPHRLDMGVFKSGLVRSIARRVLKDVFSPAPRVDPTRCTRCLACVAACPVDAMRNVGGAPRVERQPCIRCYCCHEACRFRAIAIPASRLARLLA